MGISLFSGHQHLLFKIILGGWGCTEQFKELIFGESKQTGFAYNKCVISWKLLTNTLFNTLLQFLWKKMWFWCKIVSTKPRKNALKPGEKNEEITWNFLLAKEAGTDRWVVTTMQEAKANQYWNMVKC